ncbi:MAG: GNAT family N-acetyltransferase [Lachnospiraceae bacterium]|jgi:ribosomal protein S18 acetylase RimI-like enzyme|nr:GNAT family N-acetyltransferase [Lachnospiraceae bacterium]
MKKELRLMTINDYDEIYALWRSIKGFSMRSMDDTREGVAAYLARNPHTSVVCESGGQIVGSILCGHDGRRGYLYHVSVANNARRQGIGKEMVDFCLKALKEEGITKASLLTFTHNQVGNAFWGSMGWTKCDNLFLYELALNPDNIMTINE